MLDIPQQYLLNIAVPPLMQGVLNVNLVLKPNICEMRVILSMNRAHKKFISDPMPLPPQNTTLFPPPPPEVTMATPYPPPG